MACGGASSASANHPVPPQPSITPRLFCEWSAFVTRTWLSLTYTYFTFPGPDGELVVFLFANNAGSSTNVYGNDIGPPLRQYYKISLLWPSFVQAWSARQERLVQRGIDRVRVRMIAKYHNLPEDMERSVLQFIG